MISNQMARSRLYHSLALPLFANLGLFHLLRAIQQRRSALILMYHSVLDTERRGEVLTNVNQVDLASFEWQLRFLRKHYTVVPLLHIIQRIKRNQPIRGLAAVTFDDGYLSVYENAAPVLRSLGLPCTVFIIAGCVEESRLTWYDIVEAHVLGASRPYVQLGGHRYSMEPDRDATLRILMARLKSLSIPERDEIVLELLNQTGALPLNQFANYALMSWSQIRELQSQGVSFGVHTYSHPNLSKVDDSHLRREINDAAGFISDRLAIPFSELVFCYPDGDYNNAIRDRVASSGMCGAVAVINALARSGSDPYALPRVAVAREHSRAMFSDATVGFTRGLKRLFGYNH